MRISDWSSDVCSSDLGGDGVGCHALPARHAGIDALFQYSLAKVGAHLPRRDGDVDRRFRRQPEAAQPAPRHRPQVRSEEHTSELQSLMRISYAAFCLQKKTLRIPPLT